MKRYETLAAEQIGEIFTIRLNRPPLNLFNTRMIEELIQVWHGLQRNPSARFVILTATGDHFSAGADLAEASSSGYDPEKARLQQLAGHELMRSIETAEQITVAALRGAVVGAGMAVAQACDFRIMADDSYYCVPETMIGIYYSWGCTPRLVRMVGASKAMEIIMTCDRVPAQEAHRLNLANKIVSPNALLEATNEFIAKIAAKSPTCIRIVKKIALAASMEGFGNMFMIEPELLSGVISSGEIQEGIAAFLEKRDPQFRSDPP